MITQIVPTAGQLSCTLTDEVDLDEATYIHEQIKALNNQRSPHHRHIRQNPPQPLAVWVHDEQGVLVGGLVASIYWGWLELEDFWLAEAIRQQGYGQSMLAALESEAQTRGCVRVLLRTYSFQARGFYEKSGYRVVGQLEDYPPGETFYWMRKRNDDSCCHPQIVMVE